MHGGSKSVRTPLFYVRKESQRFSFELLNLCGHIRQTLFPAREDVKVCFKTTHIWGANISLQWAGKCSFYRTTVEGWDIYWPHNVSHHGPIRESRDGIKFLPQIPIFPQLSAYLPRCGSKKHSYCFVIRWWIIGGNVKLLSNWDFLICLYLPSLWLYVYSEGGMEGSEGGEMRDHRVRRISSASLHFISPSVFIFLPLKWSE